MLPKCVKDISGNTYRRLTAVSFSRIHDGNAYWLFRCVCGNEIVRAAHSVKQGASDSCGCATAALKSEAASTHGESRSRLYRIWRLMKVRCTLETNEAYHWYGARGITVCDEWSGDYEAFRDWSLKNGYAPHLTIDREDNDLGYSPENCRWATRIVQSRNRRTARILEHDGRALGVTTWAEETGIKSKTIAKRIKDGWTVSEALTTPTRPMRRA